jgi:hypothetical protein
MAAMTMSLDGAIKAQFLVSAGTLPHERGHGNEYSGDGGRHHGADDHREG